jgi:hypothetical protein
MSDSERSPATRALDRLVAEAKEHLDVRPRDAGRDDSGLSTRAELRAMGEIDWSRVEARVMAAIDREKAEAASGAPKRDRAAVFRRQALVRSATFLFAAAAAVFVFVRKDRSPGQQGSIPATVIERVPASSLRSTEGKGEVRIGSRVATPGSVLHGGDSIEVGAARAVFERAQVVTWLLEQDLDAPDGLDGPPARAHVVSAGEPLVLRLEHGVIEAQVTPVPVGEAFAVDVATERGVVRVAVHGTHLRVARAGNRVVVDLTEGVVSIGVAPRMGITQGAEITAPAHVELDSTDLGTLRIDRDPAAVRAPIPLGPDAGAAPATHAVADRPPAPRHASTPHAPPATAGTVIAAAPRPERSEPTNAPRAKVEARKPALSPRDTIALAVRECAAAHTRPTEVRVTVTSNLRLRVSPTGTVETAQFSPPLQPEIQSCAAQVIYQTRLDETGMVTIPIEYSY